MCGIAGSTQADYSVLAAMAERLAHRGPDGQGIWQETPDGMGLVHRRLAIIDLSPLGAQPMLSPCGRHAIAFNGEIYNYRELKAELTAKGEVFTSTSDTEVLLSLLQREGLAGLDKLVGMFAFAWWNGEKGELLLARDRLGIKPLLYAPLPGGGLAFASEIEALRAHPGIDLTTDRQALSEYLACLYVPAPLTIHQGIRKLPPGDWLRWRNGSLESGSWWRPHYSGERRPSLDEAVEEILPLLHQAVTSCMVADVEVGCFLSGGLDSGTIIALMAEEAKRQGAPPPRGFTMTFAEAAYDEREGARAIAEAVGARQTELPASPSVAGWLDEMVRHFGEPFGNPTALLIHDLSRKAREHVKVALVGDGGDEVFAGYPRYWGGILASRWKDVPAFMRRGIAGLSGLIPESSTGRHFWRRAREFLSVADLSESERYAAWVEYFSPAERQALLNSPDISFRPLAKLYQGRGSSDPLDAMQETDLLSFLPGNLLSYGDAMSMAHALELRLPLLDHRLVEAVGRIHPHCRFAKGKKTLLRAAAKRLLPAAIIDAPKRGFNPPMGVWLKGELAPLLAERLTKSSIEALDLDWRMIEKLLLEQKSGRRDHALKLWALLTLDSWRRGL
jgi:asparagine synthase (glutamine-hydrolysing)